MDIILKYFPKLNSTQKKQFEALSTIYEAWNEKINLISRKDVDFLYERHVLHSLALTYILKPASNTSFLDIGTGGGFPGIPLAIMYPDCQFHLVDKIGKKISAVKEIANHLGLTNVLAEKISALEIDAEYDFILARAVTKSKILLDWSKSLVLPEPKNTIKNGCIFWKGGDLEEELEGIVDFHSYQLRDYYTEEFYQTKKIIHFPKPKDIFFTQK